jgi:trans-2,3-dihydro-3-hydroxyanthranilate isomerase
MATYPFRLVNVFTEYHGSARSSPELTGNPLCVFENGAAFSTETMQALARQFNLSETTFILPSTRAAARVRIFTPTFEMPFAGHPTLGTAHICRALQLGNDSLELEMAAGMIAVRATGDRWTLTAPSASWREFDASTSTLAAALGLEARDIGERPLWVKAGKEQLVVPLNSMAAVQRTAPNSQLLQSIRSEDGQSMAYVFALDGSGRALARFFFPQGSAILEDPATGSATANFGAWCLAMKRPLPVALQIAQGEQTGRPSSLFLNVNEQREILVGGDVIEIGRGTVNL